MKNTRLKHLSDLFVRESRAGSYCLHAGDDYCYRAGLGRDSLSQNKSNSCFNLVFFPFLLRLFVFEFVLALKTLFLDSLMDSLFYFLSRFYLFVLWWANHFKLYVFNSVVCQKSGFGIRSEKLNF